MSDRPITLLWAPRSPCNLSCEYCYFGTLETQSSSALPLYPGELSHNGAHDAELRTILQFLESSPEGMIGRVFIAGGEPLLWKGWVEMTTILKAQGAQVVLCTNGQPLQSTATTSSVIGSGVDAVSVSLDSHDPEYNDRWRKDRSGVGWRGVIAGIRTLVQNRNEARAGCKIGVYMVLTALNLEHLVQTARFVEELGVDYFVFQPVSLTPHHPLFGTLSLNESHHDLLADAVADVFSSGLHLTLPNTGYISRVLEITSGKQSGFVSSCFGGRDLFFIEPDGSVWDCPSWLKISSTHPSRRASIATRSARELFSSERRGGCTDCNLFSVDCVNMWQLMAFDDILREPKK